ncbi:MAG: 30S ribosomal protein S20 [Silvanigrellales bacterium]|jgi:small subunit ribosomal protein S20|nr:30S ribosomal protein S20 [Silvanigrellales bacterium]
MATHKSAEKRARQTIVRNLRNRHNLSTMRTAIKKVRDAIEKKDLANLNALLRTAQSVIAKTCKKGTIHHNTMARRIGRLAKAVSKAQGYVSKSV